MGRQAIRVPDRRADGRTRAGQRARLERAVAAAVREIFGDEPRVQVVVVDLLVSRPLLYAPVPIAPPHADLHKAQFAAAEGNLQVALSEFRWGTDRLSAVERGREDERALSASNLE